ncbi:unnamed protein product [Gongylonema pulchrum]|uniref:TIMELESS-interacting protein n=1 Tax=Gongylonema pulchrum TaxID=637853 RepID=A0A183DCV5_9BILA|nr:unnamed protein product [Gongylonema pulchrum]
MAKMKEKLSNFIRLSKQKTFPPDVNYLENAEVTDICKANGYPRPFPHKLASLRKELIDAFVEWRYVTFIRIAAYHVQKTRLGLLALDEDDSAKLVENGKSDEIENKANDNDDINEIMADIKVADMELPETETAKRIVEKTIESDEKKDEDNFDREISEQASFWMLSCLKTIRFSTAFVH